MISNGGTRANPTSGIIRLGKNDAFPVGWAAAVLQIYLDSDQQYNGLRNITATQNNAVSLWGDDAEDDFEFIHYNWTSGESMVKHLDGETHNVGIGISNPSAALHISKALGTGLSTNNIATIKLQNATAQGSSQLEFVEGNISGMSLRYNGAANGSANGLEVTDGFGNMYTRVDRASGNMGIGIVPSALTKDPKLQVNGDLRIEGSNELQFRTAETRQFRLGASYLFENTAGGPAYHLTPSLMIGTPLYGGSTSTLIAYFDSNTGRSGFGPRDYGVTPPQTTVDILPTGGDNPLRVNNLNLAPFSNSLRPLLIDGNGIVYRGRQNVNQNGNLKGSDPNNLTNRIDEYEDYESRVTDYEAVAHIDDIANHAIGLSIDKSIGTSETSSDSIYEPRLSNAELLNQIYYLQKENAALSIELQNIKAQTIQLQEQVAKILLANGNPINSSSLQP